MNKHAHHKCQLSDQLVFVMQLRTEMGSGYVHEGISYFWWGSAAIPVAWLDWDPLEKLNC